MIEDGRDSQHQSDGNGFVRVTWEMDLSMKVGLMHLCLGLTRGLVTPVLTSGMPSDPHQVLWEGQ